MTIFRSTLPSATRAQRGSVLIVAMLLSAIIGISLVSYLKLSQNSINLANRSFYNTAAINMAETGIEEALWCFNQHTSGATLSAAWAGWDRSDGVTAKRTFTDFSLPNNAEVAVKVYVDRYDPPSGTWPKVVSQATITIANESRTLTKWVEVTLRRRSKFAMGLVAKDEITFNGNTASVDSWNSMYNDDGTARASFEDYSATNTHANGSIGSTSVAVGSVAVNQADIWGYASVGSTTATAISVGTQGRISAFGTAAGTVDTTRVATDYTTNFENDTEPTTGTWITGAFPATIGVAGTTTTYRYNVDATSSGCAPITSSFTVLGNVTLILVYDAGGNDTVLKLTGGTDTLSIAANSSLNIYTGGDIQLTGGGVANASNQAVNFQIHGTGDTTQTIDVGGGAYLKGLIYAPNASVSIHGTPDVMGSIVANEITVVGNAKFHYDEALAEYGGVNPWGVVKWRELATTTDRATYTTAMAGW